MSVDLSVNFFSLPSELRNKIYEQLLVPQEPVACWIKPCVLFQKEGLTPALLRVNKAVHSEASSILYAQNRFDFTFCNHETVTSFLERIGRNNASCVLNVRIDFPKLHFLDFSDQHFTLDDGSVRILTKIQSVCTKLSTVTTTLYTSTIPNTVVAKALELVDACFKAFPSLPEIIVELNEDEDMPDHPDSTIQKEIKKYRWTISRTKEDSDFDSSFRDIQDCDYDHNIGDFWRIAQD
jgi:hypothetical protein